MKYLETPNSFINGIYEKTFEITHNYLLDIEQNYCQNNRET